MTEVSVETCVINLKVLPDNIKIQCTLCKFEFTGTFFMQGGENESSEHHKFRRRRKFASLASYVF